MILTILWFIAGIVALFIVSKYKSDFNPDTSAIIVSLGPLALFITFSIFLGKFFRKINNHDLP